MKRNKSAKKLALVIVLSMILAACGGTGSGGGGASSAASTASTSDASGGSAQAKGEWDEEVTLIYYTPGPPQADQTMVDQAISDYLKDDLNIKLVLTQIDFSSWNDKNNLIIASGEDCDIIFSAAWTGYNVSVTKGAYLQLDDLVNQYGSDLLKSDYAWTLDVGRYQNQLYAMPTYQILAQARGAMLRKDMVDKYGPQVGFEVKAVNTYEDLEPLLQVIKDNEPDMIPLYTNANKCFSFSHTWDRQGTTEPTAIDVAGDLVYINFYDNDYYRKSMYLARSFFEKGLVNSDIATTQEEPLTIYAAGKAFAFIGQPNAGYDDDVKRQTGIDTILYPVTPAFISTSLVQGAMVSVPRQSKNPDRAVAFINRLHTDDALMNLIVYGIEGTHYVKQSGKDNFIEAAPGIDVGNNPYMNAMWMFGNMSRLYLYGDDNPNYMENLKNFNNNAVRGQDMGFVYDSTNTKNEMAALANVIMEYDPVISSGAVDPDTLYDQFLDKLEAAGMQKLLDDQNSQLSAWLKEKNG